MSGGSLRERAEAAGVRFILAMFVDLAGKPCAKLVPAEAADEFQTDGVGFAGYAAGLLGQLPCDPDVIALPDVASFSPLPSVRPGLGLVHCDLHVEGRRWAYAPRVILAAMLDRAADRGLSLKVGAELEYFLVHRRPDGSIDPADAGDVAAQPCYDARSVTRMYEHLTATSDAMNALGWGNYANDHEDANGQFEQNFQFADAMTTADRVVTGRYLISMLAEQRDMVATFMPKPFGSRTGSGLHLHVSLWDATGPCFPDPRESALGLSTLACHFVGGLLEHAPGLSAVLAPTVNSYKRSGARTTTSGATWAPRQATYGGNDRTHLIRVPDQHRVELRSGDGSANPYLAMAAVLAAGLDGIDHALDPGSPGRRDGAQELPPTLLHAIDALDADPVISGALDAAGAGVAAYYGRAKREEFLEWHAQVSPWEIDRYLTAF
jgi:glutamine synthetase